MTHVTICQQWGTHACKNKAPTSVGSCMEAEEVVQAAACVVKFPKKVTSPYGFILCETSRNDTHFMQPNNSVSFSDSFRKMEQVR